DRDEDLALREAEEDLADDVRRAEDDVRERRPGRQELQVEAKQRDHAEHDEERLAEGREAEEGDQDPPGGIHAAGPSPGGFVSGWSSVRTPATSASAEIRSPCAAWISCAGSCSYALRYARSPVATPRRSSRAIKTNRNAMMEKAIGMMSCAGPRFTPRSTV